MAGEVEIVRRTSGRLLVVSRGQVVAGYTSGPWRSYIYPVLTPMGLPLTEESPVDHPHHNSIWLGQDNVNGYNFWLTRPGCGRVDGDVTYSIVDNVAVFSETNQWLSSQNEAVLTEERTIRITPAPIGGMCHVIDVESKRRPVGSQPVRLGQTKEAGLGMRLLQQLDGEDGGTIEDAQGRRGEVETFDQEAAWVDYWGTMAGHSVGLALLPHRRNPHQAWFTRDYGIVLWNHVRNSESVVMPGEELRLRFRLLAHDGDPREARIGQHCVVYHAEDCSA